jgi:hypothetical protein
MPSLAGAPVIAWWHARMGWSVAVGPYVTDLRNRGGVLEVASCTIEVQTDHDFTFWWLTMFDGYFETTSRTIGANTCTIAAVPL